MRDVFGGHVPRRLQSRVFVAPMVDVKQVLLAGDDRAETDLLRRVTSVFLRQTRSQLFHQPRGDLRAMERIDEAEQDQMRIESAPVLPVAREQAPPVEVLADGV